MPPFKDLTNLKYGKLTVVKLHHIKECKRKHFYWICKCDCGNYVIVNGLNLKNGHTKSCGCYQQECRIKYNTKHSLAHKTPLYGIWNGIKQRCLNKNNKNYKNYGNRGIKICDKWTNDFNSFYNWAIQNNYQEGLSIDRINVNGNYEPNNCRWVTQKIQQNNKRNNIFITYNNETHTIAEWAEIFKINKNLLYQRLNRDKLPFEKAIK